MAINTSLLANLTNITNTTLAKISASGILLPSIPSLAYLLIALIFLFAITRIGVKIIETISNFILPILIIGSAILLVPVYSSIVKMYLPQNVVKTIFKYKLLPYVFYDKILYYYAQYNIPLQEAITPFLLLYMFFIYMTYVLHKKGHPIIAPIFAYILLMILSLGGTGLLTAIFHYKPLLVVFVGTFLAYYFYLAIRYLLL